MAKVILITPGRHRLERVAIEVIGGKYSKWARVDERVIVIAYTVRTPLDMRAQAVSSK
jgi:hypothetical protein